MVRTKVVTAPVVAIDSSSSASAQGPESPAASPSADSDAARSEGSHVKETESADKATDLSRYVLMLGNFTNLPDVATLSENSRYLFTPPKGNQNWKGGLAGPVRSPVLALEFGKDIYSPEG